MKNFNIDEFVGLDKNLSSAKIAVLLSMVDDGKDKEAIEFFNSLGASCVITRAGGRGDNLKDKLFRNSLTAAENSGVIPRNEKSKYLFFNIFSKLLDKISSGIFNISGAGFKIGIVRTEKYISVAFSGKIGLPGLNVDIDVMEVQTDFFEI